MLSPFITPAGNLGALTPNQIVVQPITVEAVTKGDLVRFDLSGTLNTTYTTLGAILDQDNKKSPFNVVLKNPAATVARAGVWGVVLESAAAGSRVKVCISGLVEATVFATTSAINTVGQVLAPDSAAAGRLTQQTDNIVCVGIFLGVVASPFTAVGSIAISGTANSYVLFNGIVFGSAGS
jgi:hypothetical protein